MVFEVSSNRVRTFDDFSRSGSGRWAVHEIVGQKPKAEFLGPGQEELSFSMYLSAHLGVNPEVEMQKLRAMRDTGKTAALIVGGKPITQNFFSLESLRESHKVFSGKGKLITAEVEVVLKEYVRGRR